MIDFGLLFGGLPLLPGTARRRQGGGEDFQTYRYKPARVYEPNPNDPQETLRHTNAMAAQDTRIRGVSDETGKGLYALFSKSHCWSALWGLTSRSIPADGLVSFQVISKFHFAHILRMMTA